MKTFRALLLVLALSVSVYADGNIPYDRDGNIPYDKDGYIPNGKTVPTGTAADVALILLQSLMPLF